MNHRNQLVLIAALCCFISAAAADRPSPQPYDDEPELKGGSFLPPLPFVFDKDHPFRSGLADWSLIKAWPIKVKKIRVVGFTGYRKDNRLDWTSEDPTVVSPIGEALSPGRIRRLGISDFDLSRSRVFGGELGVLLLKFTDQDLMEEQDLVIGVSKGGFYFGIWKGSNHQVFESWLLAKLLDDILKAQTGKGLDDATFAALSGEHNLQVQRNLYEKLHRRR